MRIIAQLFDRLPGEDTNKKERIVCSTIISQRPGPIIGSVALRNDAGCPFAALPRLNDLVLPPKLRPWRQIFNSLHPLRPNLFRHVHSLFHGLPPGPVDGQKPPRMDLARALLPAAATLGYGAQIHGWATKCWQCRKTR